jgi:hypothetical protein
MDAGEYYLKFMHRNIMFIPDCAGASRRDLKILAATFVSRFLFLRVVPRPICEKGSATDPFNCTFRFGFLLLSTDFP